MKLIIVLIGIGIMLNALTAKAEVEACAQNCGTSCPSVCLTDDPGELQLTHDAILNYQSLLLNSEGTSTMVKGDYDCQWFGNTGLIAINEMQNTCYGTIKPGSVFLYPGTYCNDTGAYEALPTGPIANCKAGKPLIMANREGTSLHQQLCNVLQLECSNFIGFGVVYPFNGKSGSSEPQIDNTTYASGTCNPNWFGCCDNERCREIPMQCNNGVNDIDWQAKIQRILNKTFTVSMKDIVYRADVGAGLHPDVTMTRDFMITTWASSASSKIYYRVGKSQNNASTSWSFGEAQVYDNGDRATLTLDENGNVVGVHRSDGGYIYVKQGSLDKDNLKINWIRSEKWGKGEDPDIAGNNSAYYAVVYRDGGGTTYMKEGIMFAADGNKISWYNAEKVMGGVSPHVAINDQNIAVVIARQSDNNLVYRIARLSGDRIEWKMDKEEGYDNGSIAAITIDNFGNVIEVHKSSTGSGNLFWKAGNIDTSADKWQIAWNASSNGAFSTTGGGLDVSTPVAMVSEDLDGNMSDIEKQPPIMLIRMHGDNKVEVSAFRDNSL